MKPFTTSQYFFFGLLLTQFLYSCGDDDSAPPPGIDCNVTGPSFTFATTESACGQDDGTITLTITGGTGNLAVTIDPQPIDVEFANNTFTNVEPGSYDIEVTDGDNCSTIENVVVDFVSGTVSYMTDLDPIVQSRCAVTGCHVAGTGLPDFNVFAEFQALANNDPGGIRQRVKTDDMPRTGNPLTAEQKMALFCWIDDGALDN